MARRKRSASTLQAAGKAKLPISALRQQHRVVRRDLDCRGRAATPGQRRSLVAGSVRSSPSVSSSRVRPTRNGEFRSADDVQVRQSVYRQLAENGASDKGSISSRKDAAAIKLAPGRRPLARGQGIGRKSQARRASCPAARSLRPFGGLILRQRRCRSKRALMLTNVFVSVRVALRPSPSRAPPTVLAFVKTANRQTTGRKQCPRPLTRPMGVLGLARRPQSWRSACLPCRHACARLTPSI